MNKKFTKRLLCRISAAILSLVLLFSALPMTASCKYTTKIIKRLRLISMYI